MTNSTLEAVLRRDRLVVAGAVGVIVALAWGYIDGRADAKAQPDPDRRGDLAMTWLLAGLVALVWHATHPGSSDMTAYVPRRSAAGVSSA